MLKKKIFYHAGIFGGFLLLLSVAYWPAISMRYVYHDSLVFFLDTEIRFLPPATVFCFSIGRYLGAVFITIIGRLVSHVQDLEILRFLSIVQLSLCGLLLTNFLRKNFLKPLESFLIVALLLTLPPFQIMVCQGGMAFYPMSILVSLLSFILCFNAPEKKNILTYCSLPILGAVLLTVASLSIFQPGAMFFWALAAIFILFSRQEGFSRFWIKISKIFFVGFLGMVVYRVLLELVKKFFFHNVLGQDNSPYVVTNNFFAKVMWYLADPTIKVLNFWNIIPRKEYAFCFVLFVAGAMLLAVIQKGRKGLLGYKTREGIFKLFALLALFFLASLPNLIFPSNVSFYRCYMALSAFCVFIFLWALTTYTSFLSSMGRITRTLILVILVCFGIFQAYQTTFRYRAFPSAEELKFLQESLQAADLSQFSRVYFVQPDQKNLYTSDDEYGNLTTRFSNDIIGFFSCGIRSLMKDSYKIHYIDYDPFSGKTLYLFRKKEEWDPSSSYRVILSFGPEVKTQADFFEPTLIIDMNKVVDRIVQQ